MVRELLSSQLALLNERSLGALLRVARTYSVSVGEFSGNNRRINVITPLMGLRLDELDIRRTEISPEQVNRARQAMPNATIAR